MTKPLKIAIIATSIVLLSLALAWLVQSLSHQQSQSTDISQLSGDDFDQQYLQDMQAHHQGAIDMANQALQKSASQAIKDLATTIITNQTAENELLIQWQTDWGYATTSSTDQSASSMAHDMHAMNTSLDQLSGTEFDSQFLQQMIDHHQQAIDMSELASTRAMHQQLKDLAIKIIQEQTAEISHMKQMQLDIAANQEP